MRTTPTEWDTNLYTGDMWAACTVDVRDFDTWAELPPAEAWQDQDPAADWFSDVSPITTISPVGGTITKDWAGPAARSSAVIVLPIDDPGGLEVIRGRWVAVRAHLTDPRNAAYFIIDPLLVPSAVVCDLFITGREWNQRGGTLTVSAEDLVTLLGSRQLDTGTGPTGHLPAARTAQGVIRELVAYYAPTETVVTAQPGTPDAPWSPTPDNGTPEPLTGTVWSAIESMCTLAGLTLTADGPRIHLDRSNKNPTHTGITITETPAVSGVQAVEAVRTEAPAATRVIATGTNAAGEPIAARVTDPPANGQGFAWDATISVSGTPTPTQLGLAAVAHLDYLRGEQESGRVTIPWLPFLEPGDPVTIAWATAPMEVHYIDGMSIPLDPAEPLALALRGGTWPTWADEPPAETWAALDPAHTWAKDT